MGNQTFSMYKLGKSQWIEVTINGKTYIKNIVTSESFQFKILQKGKTNQQFAQLIQRSLYNMPRTPKIIVLSQKQNQVELLVQTSHQQIEDVISKIHFFSDLLDLIKGLINTAQSLYKKYGNFLIKENMIRFTERSQTLMWINSQFHSNEIQFIQKRNNIQFQLINKILHIVDLYTPFNINDLLYNKFVTFQTFLAYLSSLITLIKHGDAKANFKSPQKNKVFSPSHKILNHSSKYLNSKIMINHQKNNIQKTKQPRNVPQFIKNQTCKRTKIQQIKLLTHFPHRRTISIQQLNKIQQKEQNYQSNKTQQAEIVFNRIKNACNKQRNKEQNKISQTHKFNFAIPSILQKKEQNRFKYLTFNKHNYVLPIVLQNQNNNNMNYAMNAQNKKTGTQKQSLTNTLSSSKPLDKRNQMNYIQNCVDTPTTTAQFEKNYQLQAQFNNLFGSLTSRSDSSHVTNIYNEIDLKYY